ncbi:MAG: hypothetical protein ACK52I_20905, partial [Pseudomonadota bacterium]
VQQKTIGANEEGGANIEISVTSTQPKSWGDAQSLMSRKAGCGQGRAFMPEWVSPALPMEAPDTVGAAMMRAHPPGTTFIMRHRCEGPLPGEITLEPRTDEAQGLAIIRERIGGTEPFDPDGVTNWATQLTLHKDQPKYAAFNEHLGFATKSAIRNCKGPATLEKVIVAEMPATRGRDSDWKTGVLLVGIDFACVSRNDVAAASATAPSPP